MNLDKIKLYISKYKEEFKRIHKMEIYKWQAVKEFQDNYNIDAKNFHKMLSKALSKTSNLMASGSYFPRRMILENTKKSEEEVRTLFIELFQQDVDRLKRINNFSNKIKKINKKNSVKDGLKDYQDSRAIIVYLSLKYPDDNYFYKFAMFKKFAEKIEYEYIPKPGAISNISQFYSLCDIIKNLLVNDNEVIHLHQSRLSKNEYFDTSFNILTQDFIYAVSNHLDIKEEKIIDNSCLNLKSFNILINDKKLLLKGQYVDYIRKNKINKHIGDLGELLVFNYEKQRVKKKYSNIISHHSKNLGDGLGYDILSYDDNGNKKYIEVKTTKGDFDTPFYITASELYKSTIEKENYFLYRIYNYDEEKNSGDLHIIRGDLTYYCNNPRQYEVSLKIKE